MGNIKQFVAGEDLSAAQYKFVFVDGTAEKVLLTGLDDDNVTVAGVLINAPASGEIAFVQTDGIGKVTAGATLEPYDELMSGTGPTAGTAVLATTGHVMLARFEPELEGGANPADAVSGDIITVRIYDNKTRLLA